MFVKSVSMVVVRKGRHCLCVPLILSDWVTVVHLPQPSCVVTGRCMRGREGRTGGGKDLKGGRESEGKECGGREGKEGRKKGGQ